MLPTNVSDVTRAGHRFYRIFHCETTTEISAAPGAPSLPGALPLLSAAAGTLDPNLASHSASATGVTQLRDLEHTRR